MDALFVERIVFCFALISLPAATYALEKLSGRRLFRRRWIILIYMCLSWTYFDIVEDYYRQKVSEEWRRLYENRYPEEERSPAAPDPPGTTRRGRRFPK